MPELQNLLREIAILAFPILLAVTFHEVAHGYVADRLGDPTARLAGRLTLNPLKHLDVAGTLVFVLTRMIGWAKPVPVNPAYFRHPRRDMLWVGLAGPAVNLALAVVFAVAYRLLASYPIRFDEGFGPQVIYPLALMARAGVIANLGLGLFNLIPIPPLDGSRVLAGVLPGAAAVAVYRLERYGFLLVLGLVVSGALDHTLYPVLRTAAVALLGH
ncbi:MAG: site-2 protease family protein [Deferrisomatales bacterium]